MNLKAILAALQGLLTGEPARVIGYAAGLIVYLVARFTALPDIPVDQAMAGTAAYVVIVGTVVESIRHFVYSPGTVADIQTLVDELQAELQTARNAAQQAVADGVVAPADAPAPAEPTGSG